MAEVECYAFKLNTDECIRRRSEVIHDTKKLKGFVGIHADNNGLPFQYFIFKTREDRDNALNTFRGIYMTVRKEHRSLYIDEQFLKDDYVQPPIEELYGADDEFGKMIKEIKQSFRDEIQAEYDKKVVGYTNEIQKLKSQNKRLIDELLAQTNIAKDKAIQLESERKVWNDEKAKLNKMILSLESDLKRMEKQNLFVDDGK